MKKKIPFLYFIVIVIVSLSIFFKNYFIKSFSSFTVYATVPCNPSPCPETCDFSSCGDQCHCEAGGSPVDCDDYFPELCPDCVADCSDGYDPGCCECDGHYENCDEESIVCGCSNGTTYCHKYSPPSGPTNTPTPTNTPSPSPIPTLTPIPTSTSTPTPTPIQPTVIINIPFPSPQAFSKKAATEVQNWICLEVFPCSVASSNCSGKGDTGHRVRIATKADAKLIANKKTYIFECLEKGTGYRCTTGNGPLDKKLTDSNYLSALSHNYGYQFVSLTDIHNHPIVQSYDNQVIITDNKGDLGPLEWESLTTVQVGRIMMAMQQVTGGSNTSGNAKSQQLGTFLFGKNYTTTCVMIKWDPHGTVFDINSLKPIEGAKVTLLHKNKDNNFDPVKSSDVFNGLENPQTTLSDGEYAFFVPDGTYKIKLEKEGYQPVFDVVNINKNVKNTYSQLYDGGEIVTKGELELRNLAMKKITVGEKTLQILQNIWNKINNR